MKQEGPDGQEAKQETNEKTVSSKKPAKQRQMKPKSQSQREGAPSANDSDGDEDSQKIQSEGLECVMCSEWYCHNNTIKIMKKHVYTTPVDDGDRMPCWINCREDSRCREECAHDDTERKQGQEEQQDTMTNQSIGKEKADEE